MARQQKKNLRDHPIKWIEAFLNRKKQRRVTTRIQPLDEVYGIGSTTESSKPLDDFVTLHAAQTGVISTPLNSYDNLYQSGLFHQGGDQDNLPAIRANAGPDLGDCFDVLSDKEGLHKWGVSTLMPNDDGQMSLWVWGNGGASGEDFEYVLSIHEDTVEATPVDEETLVIRWEPIGQHLRFYPDLTNWPNTHVTIQLTTAQWQDVGWHKIIATWSYQDQFWTLKWDDTEGMLAQPNTVPWPEWDEMTQADIFTDLNFENSIYHRVSHLVFSPITDPEALDVLSGCVMGEPTGFPNRTDSTLTFTNGTRLFEIDPTGTNFTYYVDCQLYTSTGDDITIADTEGLHYIYYVADVLTAAVNPTNAQITAIFKDNAIVTIIYWDATNNLGIYVGEERHGLTMDGDTHVDLHFTRGLQWVAGLALNTIDADQSGANDAHAQFGVDAGDVFDEDIIEIIAAVLPVTGLNIYYLNGAGADTRLTTEAGFSCKTTGTGRLAWNAFALGAWGLAEVGNNGFVNYHVYATTEKDDPMISIMGQAEYNNKSAAQAGALTEINDISLGNLPTPEFRPIATVIFQTSNAYGNGVKARIVSTDEGDDYIDWRTSDVVRGAALRGCCSLDASYDIGDTIDYSSGNGPVVLNFPDGGTVDTIAEVLLGASYNIRNLWIQANEADSANVSTLYYTETDDVTPQDSHLMGIMSTDSGTNKYKRWSIDSGGIFQGTGFTVHNFPTNSNAIHQILQTSAIFNVQQSDINHTIKSDNRPNMHFVDAGNDTVGIDESAPDANVSLHVGSDGFAATGKGIRNDHPPRARMYQAGAQNNMIANTWAKILVDTDDYDTDTITDTGNSRITPGVEGYYLVIGSVTWSGGFAATNRMGAKLRVNNSTDKKAEHSHGGSTTWRTVSVSDIFYMDSDDYVELFGRPGTAGNTADVQTGTSNTSLALHRIS